MDTIRRHPGVTTGQAPSALVAALVVAGALLAGACGDKGAGVPVDRATGTTTTAAGPRVEPASVTSSSLRPQAKQPAAAPTTRPPVIKEGVPQVATTPSEATVGATVRFSGSGFTDSTWQSNASLWLVGTSEGGCALYAEAAGARVTVGDGGVLEGEFVVPPNGPCRQTEPLQRAEVAPGDYRLAYGCTACFIGELGVVEAALTSQSRLRADGIGPIRIGMTLDEARHVAGTPLDTVTLEGCVELVPRDPSIGIGLWSHDGRFLDAISGRTASSDLATRAGIRVGSPVEAVERAYPELVRNTDGATFLVVRAGAGMALAFEIVGGQVSHLLAGEESRIEYGAHCP